jgi:transposase
MNGRRRGDEAEANEKNEEDQERRKVVRRLEMVVRQIKS